MNMNYKTGNYRVRRLRRFVLMFLVVVLGLSFLSIGSYRLARDFQYWQQNKRIRDDYVQAVEALKLEQQQLKEELYNLQHNSLAKERLARELGYIRPGETVYKIEPPR